MADRSSDKLGLAFAGGGFRAALFHLGVLHRLAELDLLRHVQTLSTVSGGSIVGATYALRLKKWLENKSANLSADDYRALVQEVDDILCAGISQNLRTRLLLDPIQLLRVMLTQESLGRAMARLYERHILHEAVMREAGGPARDAKAPSRKERKEVRAALQLSQLRIRPKDAIVQHGIDEYNSRQEESGGSVITSLVLNATTLNSGGRFFFSGVELGDWYLGQFRRDEFDALKERRRLLLKLPIAELDTLVSADAAAAVTDPTRVSQLRTHSLALWLRTRATQESVAVPDGWERLFAHPVASSFPGDLTSCSLGLLREAKVPAWYLRFGYALDPQITGGRTRAELWERLCSVLGLIDRNLAQAVASRMAANDEAAPLLLEFIVELYLLRTGERMSDRIEADWNNLSISDAVGASANFPPVFPPFVLLGLYDDACVTRLGLTDGGVYDNVGITGLLDEECTSIIASDTGGLFDQLRAAPAGNIGMVLRLPNILMNALGGFQRLGLKEHKGLNDVAYFHISSPAPPLAKDFVPPIATGLNARTLAEMRTDLDCFGEIEMAALINQGYDTADRFARGFLVRYAKPEWKTNIPRAPRPLVRGARVDSVLKAGAARFFRAIAVRAPLTCGALVLAGLTLLVAALNGMSGLQLWSAVRNTVADAAALVSRVMYSLLGPVATAGNRIVHFLPNEIWPFLVRTLRGPVAVVVLGVAVIWVVVSAGRVKKTGSGRARVVWLQTAMKWLASWRGNLLWIAWGLPLIIALTTSAIAVIAWLLFYLPWRAVARIRSDDVSGGGDSGPGSAAPVEGVPGAIPAVATSDSVR